MFDPQLRKRLITAAVLIAGLAGIFAMAWFLCAGRWLLAASALVINIGCAYEFARLAAFALNWTKKYRLMVVYFSLAFLPSAYALVSFPRFDLCSPLPTDMPKIGMEIFLVSIVSLVAAAAHMMHLGRSSIDEATAVGSELLLGIILIAMGGGALVALSLQSESYRILLWLLITVCVNDSCAYFTGKKIGGPKLTQAISPNKTVSGSLGGIFGGMFVGLACSFLLGAEFSWIEASLMSLLTILFAQTGDLAKSYIKRLHGVKDSGNLLPGHGGVLDRSDGILAGALVPFLFLMIERL